MKIVAGILGILIGLALIVGGYSSLQGDINPWSKSYVCRGFSADTGNYDGNESEMS